MEPTSPWDAQERPSFPRLDAKIETDVAIIGGGIVGVMAAYELARGGVKVALLEQDEIGSGSSGWTTAFVTQVIDASLEDLRTRFGAETAAMVWNNGAAAIDEIEKIINEEKIDCEFIRCPANIYATDAVGSEKLDQENKLAASLDLTATFATAPLDFETTAHLQIPNQAKFNSLKFLNALAARTAELGAKFFEHSKAVQYSPGAPFLVQTAKGEVRAQKLVLATELPLGTIDNISKRLKINQTYALEADVPSKTLAPAIYWDLEKPYHYFRVDKLPDHGRIILGGEDRPIGQSGDPSERFANLKNFLDNLLPGVDVKIVREWSGRILETDDGLPFIGRSKTNEDIFYATGFSGNGMTFGVLSAMIIRDLILGKDNPSAALYHPDR